MKFLIYGAGAIGQALGCMLASDGHRVDLLLRPRFRKAIEAAGLKVTGIMGKYQVSAEQIGTMMQLSENRGPYDYILLCTKSYDTAASLEDIRANGISFDQIVSLQNGCGNLEQLEERFGQNRSIGGRVITGFEIAKPGEVKITVTADAIHLGTTTGSEIPDRVQNLVAAMDHAGHPCTGVTDIRVSLFAKLLYNCTLNPLGAILNTHYGPLGERPETRKIMDRVIEETFDVIRGLGGTTPWNDAEEYKTVFYKTLLPATYNHRPSMLQDLENNKPTEVDALVGWVEQRGRELAIPTPTCSMLADLVRFRESQRQV